MNTVHEPVLLQAVLEHLVPSLGTGVLFDGTLGGGGHSKAVLERCPSAKLVGADRDALALERAKKTLKDFLDRSVFLNGSFDQVLEMTREQFGEGEAYDAILLDLGISSDQLDSPERGFSFRSDGPLDMRMNQAQGPSAADILNTYGESELRQMFVRGGTHRGYAAALASNIPARRPFETTGQFRALCHEVAAPQESRRKSGKLRDAATVPFQALRIETNDEFGMITRFLEVAPQVLKPQGRLAIISFHSEEDKLVTQTMRRWAQPSAGDERAPGPAFGSLLTKHAVLATTEEASTNPRARSARLRVFERRG